MFLTSALPRLRAIWAELQPLQTSCTMRVPLRLLVYTCHSEITTFAFVRLLMIGETTQPALLAFVVIGLSVIKPRSHHPALLLEDQPLVLAADDRPPRGRMDEARVDVEDSRTSSRLAVRCRAWSASTGSSTL